MEVMYSGDVFFEDEMKVGSRYGTSIRSRPLDKFHLCNSPPRNAVSILSLLGTQYSNIISLINRGGKNPSDQENIAKGYPRT